MSDTTLWQSMPFINAEVTASKDAHDRAIQRQDGNDEDFTWTPGPEPHCERRKEILRAHPEVKELFRPDPLSAVFCACVVTIQLVSAYLLRDASWPVLLFFTYVVGGTANHSNVLAAHELSHDLWFKTKWKNHWFGYFANLPTGLASFSSFKRYHMEHHAQQGVHGVDADIPAPWEGFFFRTPVRKFFWVMFQPCFYALRPLIYYPKVMHKDELVNWAVVGTFDFLVLYYWGYKSMFFFLFGTFFGLGMHPMSGHFIAEHYEFIPGQETYSYYGKWGNFFGYNVGYHNEHHDFPRIPGRLLPMLHIYAPEYYLTLPSYSSWRRVIWDFVFHQDMSCFCRVKRQTKKGN